MRLAIAMGEMLLRTSRNDATLRHTTSTICLILLMIILIMPMRGVSCSMMWRGDSFVGVESWNVFLLEVVDRSILISLLIIASREVNYISLALIQP